MNIVIEKKIHQALELAFQAEQQERKATGKPRTTRKKFVSLLLDGALLEAQQYRQHGDIAR